jgi:hypothetical protein
VTVGTLGGIGDVVNVIGEPGGDSSGASPRGVWKATRQNVYCLSGCRPATALETGSFSAPVARGAGSGVTKPEHSSGDWA